MEVEVEVDRDGRYLPDFTFTFTFYFLLKDRCGMWDVGCGMWDGDILFYIL